MKIIELKNGTTIVDDVDYDFVVNLFKDGSVYMHSGYIRVEYGHPRVKNALHRILLGLPPKDRTRFADHINGVRNDNRRSNLRVVTHADNNAHKTTTKNGRYRGVYRYRFSKKRGTWNYAVQIQFRKKSYYGGHYDTKEEAAKAAENLRKKVFGHLA